MKEIEAKLKLENPSIIERANLIEVKKIKVIDIYFDSDFLNLKSEDKVLRLRNENDKSYIAFKGAREKHNDLVVREEIETEILSFEYGLKIVKNLNFYEVAKVEKIRKYFSVKNYPSLSITIDKYPFIGEYIEVEGDEKEVYGFLEEHNFSLQDTIKKNCTEIFLNYCRENNLPFENPEKHFTFEDEDEYSRNCEIKKLKN